MNLDATSWQLLQCLAPGEWVSGTQLAEQLGISREAVSRRLSKLSDLQLSLEKQAGKGYRLTPALQLLDQQALAESLQTMLPAEAIAILPTVDSSNRWLAQQSNIQLCFAEHQSGGRGRRGRDWHSPFGQNIYLSLKAELPSWPEKLSALGLVLGVALCEQLQQQLAVPMQLKWPNDLYLNGRKCGGMLIEQRGEAQGHCQLVIGLGLNVCMTRANIDQNWTSLHKEGYACSRNQLATLLSQTLLQEMIQLSNQRIDKRLQAFQQFDVYRQQNVTLLAPNDQYQGTSLGIDEWGRLRLQTEQGVEHFSVGDVSLRADP